MIFCDDCLADSMLCSNCVADTLRKIQYLVNSYAMRFNISESFMTYGIKLISNLSDSDSILAKLDNYRSYGNFISKTKSLVKVSYTICHPSSATSIGALQ